MLAFTDTAADAIKSVLSSADADVVGLRIMVESGGCAGHKYNMGLETEVQPDDEVVELAGVKVLVDPSSKTILSEVTVDFVTEVGGAGFKFNNPAATSTCGCGKSFSC